MKNKALCICDRSQSPPWCDGSHKSEGWTCAEDSNWTKYAFCAPGRYQNLARKLASHYDGALLTSQSSQIEAETLVCLLDGTDLKRTATLLEGVEAPRRLLISLGVSGHLLAPTFPGFEVHDLKEIEPLTAFARIRDILEQGAAANVESRCLESAFISHAVTDEPVLMKAVEYIREFFELDLFLCADSIGPGQNWQQSIHQALVEKDRFVMILSEHTLKSHFCSFELGVAVACRKPILLLSLDGSRPPSFVQHIQAVDLPRIQKRRPWLDLSDLLLWELLEGLSCHPSQLQVSKEAP
jgi:hypothetical protein